MYMCVCVCVCVSSADLLWFSVSVLCVTVQQGPSTHSGLSVQTVLHEAVKEGVMTAPFPDTPLYGML